MPVGHLKLKLKLKLKVTTVRNNEARFVICRQLYRVVGFEVETYSVHYDEVKVTNANGAGDCVLPNLEQSAAHRPQPIMAENNGLTNVRFTYAVRWKPSDISWASRWDIYLAMNDVEIHWFPIINSIVVIFFLTGKLCIVHCAPCARGDATSTINRFTT